MTLNDQRIGEYNCDSKTRTFHTEFNGADGTTHIVMWGAEEGNEDLEIAQPSLNDIRFERGSNCLYSMDPNS